MRRPGAHRSTRSAGHASAPTIRVRSDGRPPRSAGSGRVARAAGRYEGMSDAVFGQDGGQFVAQPGPVRRDDQRGAGQHRDEQLQHGGVEAGRGELQHAVAGTDGVAFRGRRGETGDAPVRDGDALGGAGGAGGEDDVRGVVGEHPVRGCGRLAVLVVQQCADPVAVVQDDGRCGVGEHQFPPFGGVVGIDGQEGGTGQGHGQLGGDQFHRARQGQSHRPLRSGTVRGEVGGEPAGSPGEFAVRPGAAAVGHRGGVRVARHPAGEHLTERDVPCGPAGTGRRDGTGRWGSGRGRAWGVRVRHRGAVLRGGGGRGPGARSRAARGHTGAVRGLRPEGGCVTGGAGRGRTATVRRGAVGRRRCGARCGQPVPVRRAVRPDICSRSMAPVTGSRWKRPPGSSRRWTGPPGRRTGPRSTPAGWGSHRRRTGSACRPVQLDRVLDAPVAVRPGAVREGQGGSAAGVGGRAGGHTDAGEPGEFRGDVAPQGGGGTGVAGEGDHDARVGVCPQVAGGALGVAVVAPPRPAVLLEEGEAQAPGVRQRTGVGGRFGVAHPVGDGCRQHGRPADQGPAQGDQVLGAGQQGSGRSLHRGEVLVGRAHQARGGVEGVAAGRGGARGRCHRGTRGRCPGVPGRAPSPLPARSCPSLRTGCGRRRRSRALEYENPVPGVKRVFRAVQTVER